VDIHNQAWKQKFKLLVRGLNHKMKLLNDRFDTLSKQVTEKIDKLTEKIVVLRQALMTK
jgi:hypothetical protein